jgi:thiol-disulfide isomerase/thioredoxin
VTRKSGAVLLAMLAIALAAAGCSPTPHPAVGLPVGSLPLVSLTGPDRRAPQFAGRVTLLNFWGTWCMPCRRELPGLARLAKRLEGEPVFQLVAVSCGAGGVDDPGELAATTGDFLAREKLAIDAWADPDGRTRLIFSAMYGLAAFPTTYLIGPDAQIRRVWTGYSPGDESQVAAAVVAVLKEAAAEPGKEPAQEPVGTPVPARTTAGDAVTPAAAPTAR